MAKKTGRVTRNRKRTTRRDLRPVTTTTVKGGATQAFFQQGVLTAHGTVPYPGFAGGVRVASGDVNDAGGPTLRLVK